MSRIHSITEKTELPVSQRPLFDNITAVYDGRVVGPFRILLHSPELANRFSEIGRYLRLESALPASARELAILLVARETDCPYEWMAHEPAANSADVSEAAINTVRHSCFVEGVSESELVILEYVRDLLRGHRVSEVKFRAALDLFGVRHLIELTATVGFYIVFAYVMNSFHMPPDRFVDLPVGYSSRKDTVEEASMGSTLRVPLVTNRNQLSKDDQGAFDEITASRGRVVGPFQVLLNSPEIARRIAYAGEYIRYESVLPDDVRELAIITSARENWCQFEWAAHEPIARRVGVTEETIRDIRDGSAGGNLKGAEAVVVNFTRELMRLNRVSETTFNAGLNEFGEQGLVELTATLGYYSMLACLLNAFDVRPDNGTQPL